MTEQDDEFRCSEEGWADVLVLLLINDEVMFAWMDGLI